jgi:hypothetical protein
MRQRMMGLGFARENAKDRRSAPGQQGRLSTVIEELTFDFLEIGMSPENR